MLILRLLSRLPLRVLFILSDVIFLVTFYLLRYRRKIVQQNLKNSFPSFTSARLKFTERQFYRNLCDYSVETLRLLSIDKQELQQRVKFLNPEIITPFTNKNQSVIILAAHQFNWEWLLAGGCLSLPVPVDFVYQPQSSRLATRFSMAVRTRFSGFPVQRESVGREALKRQHITRATAIVADQFPGHFNHRKHWTTFLGQRTAFFYGLTQLATLMKAPVFFASIVKTSRGNYEVELQLLKEPPYTEANSLDIIEEYVKASEKLIHHQPEGWLWSHKRWKQQE